MSDVTQGTNQGGDMARVTSRDVRAEHMMKLRAAHYAHLESTTADASTREGEGPDGSDGRPGVSTSATDHPLVHGMFAVLPELGSPLAREFMDEWIATFDANLRYMFR